MRRAAGGLISVALLSATLAACGTFGDLTFFNESTEAVTITTDHETFELPVNNGSSLLDNGCNEGSITVTFASGSTATVAGPVYPGKQVTIRDGQVNLTPA